MTRFTATNQSSATLKSSREDIWKALTDPELLPRLTPYLQNIAVDGDRWTWNVTKIPLMGKSIGTCFTEIMSFDEPSRISFSHDDSKDEPTWVDGEYHLKELDRGTEVSIELTVTSELPFPKFMRGPVQAGMYAVMAGMGRRFAHNLLRHLGEK